MNEAEVLRAEGLTRVLGEVTAVAGVSLTIAAGEWVSLVGPSGCGKTTLLQMLGLLDRPTAGQLRLAGVDPWKGTVSARTLLRRERIGFVFQGNNLIEYLTARENVALPAWRLLGSRGAALAAADGLLDRLGLSARADTRAALLSMGEGQRVASARALVNRPQVVLADEPTGNLDKASGEIVMAALGEVCVTGSALLVVTHDVGVAARANRTLTMSDGRILDR
ncbi:MAG: ABC transporter ATP-binding protein [Deltaproteobacteria bacterium]|nr:MAG: ABC transporter ATP-binding protein [Deltaproteobacteria bacterium]